MGYDYYGVVFFGWHFELNFLKEKVVELTSDPKGDEQEENIGIFEARVVDVEIKDGRNIKMHLFDRFREWTDIIFGRILAIGQVYRDVECVPVPMLGSEEANLITLLFEERGLGVKPGLYLIGSGPQ